MRLWRRSKSKTHRTRLGDLLIKHGAAPERIENASTTYYDRNRFGEYCLEQGACTKQQLDAALAEQAIERGDYAESDRLIKDMVHAVQTGASVYVAAIMAQIDTLLSNKGP
jgi:hypothetical protein